MHSPQAASFHTPVGADGVLDSVLCNFKHAVVIVDVIKGQCGYRRWILYMLESSAEIPLVTCTFIRICVYIYT